MDIANQGLAPARSVPSGRQDPADMDIDWERVVYDPDYRQFVRDELNRAKGRRPADKE